MDDSPGRTIPQGDLPPALAEALAELERLQEETLERGMAYFSAPPHLAPVEQRRYYEAMTAEVQAMLRLEKARRGIVAREPDEPLPSSPESSSA